ncbi:SUKH-4 family immunity protein [Streptomyces sp. CBMA370]|uniref:SUKH-4 family immunity protein n=1 Tax=Streptomyces sp. CBMA370 TaxID=1930278 RepID=UPI001661DD84|nr:SUKH-4 family immunity protein [Streptomyces sp. CBMA370]MBD0716203.1 hypothetical protein [Streptomyces sp. CBMA370]
MTEADLLALLDDPARLPHHDRDVLRARLAALPDGDGGVGREVFTQAEAVFGTDPVTPAEFGSWLHFAATVLGHEEYAERVAVAVPALPWRTVWAWWRPVGVHETEPNLSGDRSAEVYEADGRRLLRVEAPWCEETWFDLATGRRVAAPEKDTAEPSEEGEPDGPWLFDPDDENSWALRAPYAWEEPVPLGGGRFVFQDARGVAVVEQDDKALADWPRGGADPVHRAGPEGGPWFRPGTRETDGPLTAARLDRAFGAGRVVRTAAADLPAALTHAPTRTLLAEAGIPRFWTAGVTSFARDGALPVSGPEDLLTVGTFDLGYRDRAEVLLHPTTGAVGLRRPGEDADGPGQDADRPGEGTDGPGEGTGRAGEAVVPFARDLDAFVRLLEAVRRHMGACWDPYPGEGGAEIFLRAAREVDGAALAEGAPGLPVWEHVFAAVTELGVDGY